MKRLFLSIAVLLFTRIILYSQHFCVEVQTGRYNPSFTHLNGETPNCGFVMNNTDYPDLTITYVNRSALLFSASIGYQKDWFTFGEITRVVTYGGPLTIAKVYQSIPIIFSSGYIHNVFKSHLFFKATAGIGFGVIHSDAFNENYSFDNGVDVIDDQGTHHLDSQHVLITVEDSPMKKTLPQVRFSLSTEYHFRNFFVLAFCETRCWLSNFEEITYHSENSSTYYNYNRSIDGHFSTRPGYFGYGAGVGWCFNNKKGGTIY